MTSTFIIHYPNLSTGQMRVVPGVCGILLIQQDCSFSSGHYSFSSCVGGAEVVHPIHYSDNGIEFLNQFYTCYWLINNKGFEDKCPKFNLESVCSVLVDS